MLTDYRMKKILELFNKGMTPRNIAVVTGYPIIDVELAIRDREQPTLPPREEELNAPECWKQWFRREWPKACNAIKKGARK